MGARSPRRRAIPTIASWVRRAGESRGVRRSLGEYPPFAQMRSDDVVSEILCTGGPLDGQRVAFPVIPWVYWVAKPSALQSQSFDADGSLVLHPLVSGRYLPRVSHNHLVSWDGAAIFQWDGWEDGSSYEPIERPSPDVQVIAGYVNLSPGLLRQYHDPGWDWEDAARFAPDVPKPPYCWADRYENKNLLGVCNAAPDPESETGLCAEHLKLHRRLAK